MLVMLGQAGHEAQGLLMPPVTGRNSLPQVHDPIQPCIPVARCPLPGDVVGGQEQNQPAHGLYASETHDQM